MLLFYGPHQYDDLMSAVEGLTAPTTLAFTRTFKPLTEQKSAAPPLPPRREFRQGEI